MLILNFSSIVLLVVVVVAVVVAVVVTAVVVVVAAATLKYRHRHTNCLHYEKWVPWSGQQNRGDIFFLSMSIFFVDIASSSGKHHDGMQPRVGICVGVLDMEK